jgi:hypothetical protein
MPRTNAAATGDGRRGVRLRSAAQRRTVGYVMPSCSRYVSYFVSS